MLQINPETLQPTTLKILQLFRERGNSMYGGEAVTQLEHALQAAYFAECEGSGSELISAALLHDIGHLLHALPADAPDQGIDDVHELLGYRWLQRHFGPAVSEPVRMHVDAKRYLCATNSQYLSQLSRPSIVSLHLQGGPMSPLEIQEFQRHPFFETAIHVRRWDDRAKIENLPTPEIEHFARHLDRALQLA